MKKQLFSVISIACIALFTGCGGQQSVEEDVKPSLTVEQLEVATTLAVKIDGMSCPNGCAKPIEVNCAKLVGVAESHVDFASGMGYFTYDATKLSQQDLIACIEGTNGGEHYKVVMVQDENGSEEPTEETEVTM